MFASFKGEVLNCFVPGDEVKHQDVFWTRWKVGKEALKLLSLDHVVGDEWLQMLCERVWVYRAFDPFVNDLNWILWMALSRGDPGVIRNDGEEPCVKREAAEQTLANLPIDNSMELLPVEERIVEKPFPQGHVGWALINQGVDLRDGEQPQLNQ